MSKAIRKQTPFRYLERESTLAVTQKTVKALKARLGLTSDNAVIHYALARLRDIALRYPLDDGPVSDEVLHRLNRRYAPKDSDVTESLLRKS
jgi:hypothetical protein